MQRARRMRDGCRPVHGNTGPQSRVAFRLALPDEGKQHRGGAPSVDRLASENSDLAADGDAPDEDAETQDASPTTEEAAQVEHA